MFIFALFLCQIEVGVKCMNDKSFAVLENQQIFNPKRFVRFVKTNRGLIKHVSFIPGKLGSRNFGKFVVHLNTRRRNEQSEYSI